MTRPEAKGWCPSAYVPMLSGDGLLVRIKPAYSQLTATALCSLAELADKFGNGLLDLTSRANLQIRGVSERNYPALLAALREKKLIQPTQRADLLNVMLAPFTNEDSLGWRCASAVYAAAEKLPDLPAKFGFCIDCGDRRYLTKASGDLWIEKAADGGLLLRCTGQLEGMRTDESGLMSDLLKLIDWYQAEVAKRPQTLSLRMRGVLAHTPVPYWATGSLPQADEVQLVVGEAPHHFIVAAAYGQLRSQDLRQLATVNKKIQFTSDRLMVVSALPDNTGQLICNPEDRRFYIAACPGAPHCVSATINTKQLADSLSLAGVGAAGQTVHISGCPKGCAAPLPRDICVVGINSYFAVIDRGCAWDTPSRTGLSRNDVLKHIKDKVTLK